MWITFGHFLCDCLIAKPEDCSQPRELWLYFNDNHVNIIIQSSDWTHWSISLSCHY